MRPNMDRMSAVKPRISEESAIVLDILPNGYAFDARSHKKSPMVQAVGVNKFSLLELVPKHEATIRIMDEVYIGEGKRDHIHHVNGRLAVDKLTNTARNQLDAVLTDLIKKQEARFVEFFNKAQPLTMRMHQMELIPGIGKKHMWDILEAREEKPFTSFADIRERVKLLSDPAKAVMKRILLEMEGNEKHRLFTEN
jgi:putative nucleotide binding protein